MTGRVWNAYKIEVMKALRLKFTYAGPVLVMLVVLCMPLVRTIDRDGVSDYAFIAYVTPVALNLLGLLILLAYCANQISTEMASGTIRMVLLRPLRRHEFLIAKLLLGMTYAAVLTLSASGASWAIAFALGDLGGVSFGGEVIHTTSQMVATYLVCMLLGLLPQFAAASFAIMISTFTRSSGAAVGTTVGIWLVADIVKHPLRVAPFLFSTYIETPWQVFASRCDGVETSWYPEALYVAATSTVSLFLFAAIAIYVLSRRNLHA